jgi:hypothetical protein
MRPSPLDFAEGRSIKLPAQLMIRRRIEQRFSLLQIDRPQKLRYIVDESLRPFEQNQPDHVEHRQHGPLQDGQRYEVPHHRLILRRSLR